MQYKILFFLTLLGISLLPAQVMFPGDLNNDGRANHIDLLPLGVAYGQLGPLRPAASTEWIAQETELWGPFLPVSGVNLAFVDADGNGRIDSLDLDAIALNYDSLQTTAFPPPLPYLLTDTFRVENRPRLVLTFNRATALPGDTVIGTIDLIIPDPAAFPPTNPPLAIALTLRYDPSLFDNEQLRIEPEVAAGDLMYVAATANSVDFGRSPPVGSIQLAFSGRGQGALAASRTLAKFTIIIEDMILLTAYPEFTIEETLFITLNEQVIDLTRSLDSFLITSNQPVPTPADEWQISPNPCQTWVRGWCPTPGPVYLQLVNATGQCLAAYHFPRGRDWQIDMTAWPPGLYFLLAAKQNGQWMQPVKLIKN
jgi:hypothetical protein